MSEILHATDAKIVWQKPSTLDYSQAESLKENYGFKSVVMFRFRNGVKTTTVGDENTILPIVNYIAQRIPGDVKLTTGMVILTVRNNGSIDVATHGPTNDDRVRLSDWARGIVRKFYDAYRSGQ